MTWRDSLGASAPTVHGRLEHAPRTATGRKPGGVGIIRVVVVVRDGPTLATMMR